MKRKATLAVLVSGRGSNLQAIIDQIEQGKLSAEIAVVITDKKEAHALTRIKNTTTAGVVVAREAYADQLTFEDKLMEVLRSYAVDFVILAGFMRILSNHFVSQFSGRLINIHPSLLPSFPGLHAQRQALDYGVKYTGCTVHYVNEQVDGGPIILQSVVPVMENDSEASLSERILKEEHRILPQAIKLLVENRLMICNRTVLITQQEEKGVPTA